MKSMSCRFLSITWVLALAISAQAQETVIVAGDANTTASEGWYYAGAASQGYEGNLGMYASVYGAQKTYTFSADLPLSSLYSVEVFNSCYTPRSQQVKHHISGQNGTSTVIADQNCATDPYVGTWRLLGNFFFEQGGVAEVTIDSDGSDNDYIGATAVRFVALNTSSKSLIVGDSSWMPFADLYGGPAVCSGPGSVTGLPPGIAIDSVCNLYGTASEPGDFTTVIPLDDGSAWHVAFTITAATSESQDEPPAEEEPEPVEPPTTVADTSLSLPVDMSAWVPIDSHYTGTESCDGQVLNLPPGMFYDTICNIYGTPSATGVYLATIPFGNSSDWAVEFNITVAVAQGGEDPNPVDPVTEDPGGPDPYDPSPEDPAVEDPLNEEPGVAPADVVVSSLQNPILFSLVVPPLRPNSFGYQLEAFANHMTGMINQAPRGGDIALMDENLNVRLLTKEAGFGVESGSIQGEQAIAVRQPSVHWDGTRALFSMVIGGPESAYDQSYRANRWQIYEITNLDAVVNGAVPDIQYVQDQPPYNNMSPVYGEFDAILFTSDAPLYGMDHTYPQYDEYESTPTNTGIFKLDRMAGEVIHLSHSPSGDFDLSIASDGRVISTRWEHLKRDQQANNHRSGAVMYQPVNFDSEATDASIVSAPAVVDGRPFADADGTPYEIFPEAFVHIVNGIEVEPNRDPNESLHDFNEFLPWEISQYGEAHQTMNHVGRHEFGGSFADGSKLDDPNLTYQLGSLSSNAMRDTVGSDAGIFQIKEDPRPGYEGTFYGVWAEEFSRFASGRIFEFALPPGANPQHMEVVDWTNPLIDNAANDLGHFRNPLMTANGTMLASWAPQSGVFGPSEPEPFQFRLVEMIKRNTDPLNTEHVPSAPLMGNPIQREIVYWGDSTTPFTATVDLLEVEPVEVVARTAPAVPEFKPIDSVEQSVLIEEGVDELELRDWMISKNLALIVIRNVTERDAGERQQPFNLRVPGGVETIPSAGKVYDVSHFQLFSAELIRSYGMRNLEGRRVIATPLRDNAHHPDLMANNIMDPLAPVDSAVKIAPDGSVAAFVPATRAMTWQSVAPDGEAIVRERQWVTFAPGEVRTCAGCHGINDTAMSGNLEPLNKPEALRELLQLWKHNNMEE